MNSLFPHGCLPFHRDEMWNVIESFYCFPLVATADKLTASLDGLAKPRQLNADRFAAWSWKSRLMEHCSSIAKPTRLWQRITSISMRDNERVNRAGKARASGDVNWHVLRLIIRKFPIKRIFYLNSRFIVVLDCKNALNGRKTVKLSADPNNGQKAHQKSLANARNCCFDRAQADRMFLWLSRLTFLSLKYSLLNPAY